MKKIILKFSIIVFSVSLLMVSCTEDFGELNRAKDVTNNANIGGLFAYSLNKTQVEYYYWFYNGRQLMEQIQLSVPPGGNNHDFGETLPGLEYDNFYSNIAPNLFEIRNQIDNVMDEEDAAKYQCIYATTYLVQVYNALQLTEMYGDIPYTEAIQGRFNKNFSPKYDDQKALLNTFISEIDASLATLVQKQGDNSQKDFSDNGDFVYFSDWAKWIKFGNSLKIKIAVKLHSAGENVSAIVSSAINGGLYASRADQFKFDGKYYYGSDAMGYFNNRAAKNFVDFLNLTNDPRRPLFLEKNELTETMLTDNTSDLPDFINNAPSLNEKQFIGGFVSPDKRSSEDGYEKFWGTVNINEKEYRILSLINRKLFDPKMDVTDDGDSDGHLVDYWLGYPELCFYMAELIEKGVTSGDAEDWYKKGVQASIENYEYMATRAKLTHDAIPQTAIDAYLSIPEVAYSGNKLEKIGIQQYLNLFRNPTENFFYVRRTGYPKSGSSILARESISSKNSPVLLVRRGVLSEPNQYNITNWEAAQAAQGFSAGETNNAVIYNQRVWLDKNNPDFGTGN